MADDDPPGTDTAADGLADIGPDERALLDAFDRLRPVGSLQWGFEDAMRRVADPDTVSVAGALPWSGLPADLWERGRSARIGQRFVGDVAGVLAEILANDARAAADAAVATANVAAWDALRYLAARVELLEARVEPFGLEIVEQSIAPADVSAWVEGVGEWLGAPDPDRPVVVGESGAGELARALAGAGHRVLAVEPRGALAWDSLADPDGGRRSSAEVTFGEVGGRLQALDDGSVAGVVLSGCTDRADLAGKSGLVAHALRVTRAGGNVVILTVDQDVWDAALSRPARDLVPGRPLHPETWQLVLERAGAGQVVWHRPTDGAVHALVATVST
ncbi:MAG: hypothetical protein ACLQPH_07235 [Acidimicrobiales bacterium]